MQLAVRETKLAFKRWQSKGTEEAQEQSTEKNRQAKRMVAVAKVEPGNTGVNLFNQTKEEQRC